MKFYKTMLVPDGLRGAENLVFLTPHDKSRLQGVEMRFCVWRRDTVRNVGTKQIINICDSRVSEELESACRAD